MSKDSQIQAGLAIEAQRDMCRAYVDNANTDNAEVVEYCDIGYSGALSVDKRPGLLEAVNSIGKDDVLIVAKRDRLGRDPIVNAMIERHVARKRARLISASGDTSDDNDPTSVLMRRMVDAFSEYERLMIGARTKVALQIKRRRGERVAWLPFGYRLVKGKYLKKDDAEQAIIKQIFDLREQGVSYRKIAQEMNKRGFPKRKKQWNTELVTRMISRPTVYESDIDEESA